MATKKYTVTLPEELAEAIRAEVGPGGFSRYVTHAIERQREQDRLGEAVDWWEKEYGQVTRPSWPRPGPSVGRSSAGTPSWHVPGGWPPENRSSRHLSNSGRVRREGEAAYLLDCEGLSRWVRGERRMGVRVKDAHRLGVRVMTTSMTLIEAYDVRTYLPTWHWALSRVHVEPVTEEIAQEAIGLLEEAGLHGHKYAIDAALAAVALRQPGPVTVFTSDEDDLRKPCGDRVVVRSL
jgi:hypothetical protein